MAPKLSTLQDAFTATTVNTSVWNSSSVGQYTLDTVNDQVLLNVGTTAFSFPSFGSGGPWDATNSSLYAQVTPAPNGNGGVQTILKLDAGSNNAVSLSVASGGQFKAQVTTNGAQVSTPLPTYDPHQHRWWKLTEAGGSFVFAASPDGLNWTNLATMAYTFAVTAVAVYFQTGTSDVEPSGMVAAIAHVNTMAGGLYNYAWPRVEDAWGPAWNANAGQVPTDRYVDVSKRTRGSMSFSRGRQYELDQVRAGEGRFGLANNDAVFDQTNTSSPWYQHIKPYQPFRRRAQWPPTRNLLTQAQATGGDLGGYSTGTIPSDIDVTSDLGTGSIVATSSAWRGGRVFDLIVASGAVGNSVIFRTGQSAAEPGTTYTHSVWVRNVAASGTLQVKPYIAWYTAGSSTPTYVDGSVVGLVGSTSAAWTTLTITATAPANVAGIEIGVRTSGGSVDAEVQVDSWQLEQGSPASAWACPGVWYPVYAGFMERWPSQWDMAGTYGTVQPTAVDALALLSQVTLSDPLTEEINSVSPRFLFKLDDPSGSTTANDATGNFPAVPIAVSKYGAGSITFGNNVTATDTVNGVFTGAPGPVVTVNNASPGTNTTAAASFFQLGAVGIKGPANPGLYTRALAFRYTGPTPTAAACLWSCMDNQRANGNPSGSRIYLYILTDGKPYFYMTGPDGSVLVNTACTLSKNVVDGNWHFVSFGWNWDTGQVMVSLDGTSISSNVTPAMGRPTGIVGDNLGGFVDVTVGQGTTWNFKGDIAFAGEWPALLTSVQLDDMYQAWRNSCAGDTSDQRYARILRYSGYSGPSVIQAGLTMSMGPANIDGQDVVTALENVVTTENGEHFVDRSGVPTFRARSARYNATTPVYIFGERADLGEWPYEDVKTDYDSTHLANDVAVTQESTGQVFHAKDMSSSADYFPRTLTRTINSTSAPEVQDATSYLLSRYRQPLTRISSLTLHPSALPALWPVCLSLELGMRVRVMRRAPGVPAIQVDCFIENIAWTFGDDNEAQVTLQCSPADLTPYGIFASFHTTLAVTAAAGASTITINAGSDNTNPAAAQIGQGQLLVLSQGTASQEQVIVLSVAATSPGWSTVAVTLQSPTSKSHNAGDLVCEPLPTGVTDPTSYDSSARFDAVNFAY